MLAWPCPLTEHILSKTQLRGRQRSKCSVTLAVKGKERKRNEKKKKKEERERESFKAVPIQVCMKLQLLHRAERQLSIIKNKLKTPFRVTHVSALAEFAGMNDPLLDDQPPRTCPTSTIGDSSVQTSRRCNWPSCWLFHPKSKAHFHSFSLFLSTPTNSTTIHDLLAICD